MHRYFHSRPWARFSFCVTWHSIGPFFSAVFVAAMHSCPAFDSFLYALSKDVRSDNKKKILSFSYGSQTPRASKWWFHFIFAQPSIRFFYHLCNYLQNLKINWILPVNILVGRLWLSGHPLEMVALYRKWRFQTEEGWESGKEALGC